MQIYVHIYAYMHIYMNKWISDNFALFLSVVSIIKQFHD